MDLELIDALTKARYESGLSQREIAEELKVSKKTVQNWEQGTSQPPIEKIFAWFRACGENPMHWLLEYASPKTFVVNADNHDEIDKAFASLSEVLTYEDKYAILCLFYGRHGSSPESVIQLILAHLQNPLSDRISTAIEIATHYRINKGLDNLVGDAIPEPKLDVLDEAILSAYESVKKGRKGYTIEPKVQQ